MDADDSQQMAMRAPTEHDLQAAFIELVGWHVGRVPALQYLRAIPNGGLRPFKVNPKTGARYSVEGQRLRAEGVKPDIPDLVLPVPSHGFHGLWMEFKRPDGTVPPGQRDYLRFLLDQGYCATVVRDPEAALAFVLRYLDDDLPTRQWLALHCDQLRHHLSAHAPAPGKESRHVPHPRHRRPR